MSEKYPEHAKLRAVQSESQAVGRFIEWLQDQGVSLARHNDTEGYVPEYKSIAVLLAEYFEIDLNKIEDEKQKMIEELYESQSV